MVPFPVLLVSAFLFVRSEKRYLVSTALRMLAKLWRPSSVASPTMIWRPVLENLRWLSTVSVSSMSSLQIRVAEQSAVAVIAGILLPRLTQRDSRLLAHEGDEDEDAEFARLKATVQQWRAEAARRGEPLKLPFMPFFLRNIWTGAMLLFALITFSTFFITKVWQAIIAVSLVGICWAVACWVPFAIIMEVRALQERVVFLFLRCSFSS